VLEFSLKLPEENQIYDVVIIGGGPAGLSAALYAARAKLRTLVLDKNPSAGALGMAEKIENYPGVGRIKGSELLNLFRAQAEGFGAEVQQALVGRVDLSKNPKKVVTPEKTCQAKTVIVATGAMGRKPSIKGEAELIGKGVSYCAACDAAFFKGEDVAVVGRVEAALEEIHVVARHARKVYLITPSRILDAEQAEAVHTLPNVEVRPGSRVIQIAGDSGVRSVEVAGPEGNEQRLEVTGVFVYMHGSQPIVDFLDGALETTSEGCIKAGRDMSTSVEGVFAAGDVTCKEVRQVAIAAAEGCIAALSADRYINKHQRARPQWS
jgi:thioredoxin reductase (NADPH)